MSVIKRRYTSNFTTIGNALFEDERLSADEVGILAYLRSRPHDWEVRRPALARRWKMGREAIKRVVTSLVRTGWCVARKDRAPDGTFFMVYEIRDEPGPTLTDDQVRQALSLVSSEAVSDENHVVSGPNIAPDEPPQAADPPTGYPSLADPPPADPHVAYIDIQNKDLPRTDSTQKPEREGARAREKHALNLAKFKQRWPTAANDDQARIDSAWWKLSNEEGEAALDGIVPFLENQKKFHRKHTPAGFTYLEQRRWTLLEQLTAAPSAPHQFPANSPEGRAIATLFEIAGKSDFFHKAVQRAGTVYCRVEIEPQLLALASVKPRSEWKPLTREQAAAWDRFVHLRLGDLARSRIAEGALAPEPWHPNKDGTWPKAAGPTDEDLDALASEGHR